MFFPSYYPFLLLLLCVSLHACNSRHLGLLNKEAKNEVHLSCKDEEAEKTIIVLKNRRRSIFEQLHPEEIHMAKFGGKRFPEGLENINPMRQKGFNLEKENMNGIGGGGGIHNKVSSLTQKVLPDKTGIKGWKIQARSTMESKKQDDTKENVKSEEENDVVEDVVVMDYAQPHRKPPIHNLEP